MMKLVYKYSIIGLILFFTIPNTYANDNNISQLFTQTIKRDFKIIQNGTTTIQNKYGKVSIETWDNSRVKIEINIEVNARTETDAQDVFDRIDINFSNNSDYVRATTTIEDKSSSWWNWGGSSNNDFTINYNVYLPSNNNVEVENKYGDVYVANINGNLEVEVKYGNFQLDGAKDATIYLGYGKGMIDRLQTLTGEVAYSNLQIEESKYIDLTTKYSKVYIDRAYDLKSDSKYDTYTIGEVRYIKNIGKYDNFKIEEVEDMNAVSKYSNFNIQELKKSLDLDLNYGGARVEGVDDNFTDIHLVGNYADFKIYMNSNVRFRMEAYANYAGIRTPDNMKVTHQEDNGTSKEVTGYVGSNNAKGLVKVRLNYGGLRVQ